MLHAVNTHVDAACFWGSLHAGSTHVGTRLQHYAGTMEWTSRVRRCKTEVGILSDVHAKVAAGKLVSLKPLGDFQICAGCAVEEVEQAANDLAIERLQLKPPGDRAC